MRHGHGSRGCYRGAGECCESFGTELTFPCFSAPASGCTSVPIVAGDVALPVVVSTLYGTGIRGLSSLSEMLKVTVDGQNVPVQYAGAQPQFPGLDQVNVSLPLTLRGAGESNVVVTVDGQISNIVTINVK